jgi:Arc/MetJ-type ribon-helix-helix transcriptional regulator
MVSVRLTPKLERRLERAAQKRGLTKSEFIRESLEASTNEALAGEQPLSDLWDEIDAIPLPEPTPFEEMDKWSQYLWTKHRQDSKEFLRALIERRARPR